MIREVLAFWTPGPLEVLIIFFVSVFVFVIPVFLIIFVLKSFVKHRDETKKMLSEVEQLKEEINKLKQ